MAGRRARCTLPSAPYDLLEAGVCVLQQRPEAVLILRPNTRRYAQIARFAGVKARVGAVVYSPRVARLLTHVVPLNPYAHQVEKNLAVAEAWLGRQLPRYPLHYAPAQHGRLPDALTRSNRYAVLHLSTGGVQPQWLPTDSRR